MQPRNFLNEPLFAPEHFTEHYALVPFQEERAYLAGVGPSPLQQHREVMLRKAQKWHDAEDLISSFFAKRQGNKAKPYVLYHMSEWLQMLYWCNQELLSANSAWQQQLASFSVTVMNAEERMAVVLAQPHHYIAFVVLRELFLELEKKIALLKGKHASLRRQ
ncbi:hypothetical protein A374_03614 [Fictibacillus macauensis ZFHKF-1]|uniref:YpoC-like domain-containing protein n=1 Tax=Fictibacillus macauensis ZFHKF-1 TaxID=1196324 RepID=I8AL75_9BACL|nr:hypothetical protein [Fictibacillus macauensis]EIT86627.1 hypothetical protein A374_03614 [Fictibacillus macauensis ZFHKF-1]